MEQLSHRPWIILLSGPSCSGKSTLARTLQKELSTAQRPFLHLEADALIPELPAHLYNNTIFFEAFLKAFHRSFATYPAQGVDIIVDGLLPYNDPDGIKDVLSLFKPYQFCYVGVYCDLKTLEEREQNRSDRKKGWAKQQLENIHDFVSYDIMINTSTKDQKTEIEKIKTFITDRDSIIFSPKSQHSSLTS